MPGLAALLSESVDLTALLSVSDLVLIRQGIGLMQVPSFKLLTSRCGLGVGYQLVPECFGPSRDTSQQLGSMHILILCVR